MARNGFNIEDLMSVEGSIEQLDIQTHPRPSRDPTSCQINLFLMSVVIHGKQIIFNITYTIYYTILYYLYILHYI